MARGLAAGFLGLALAACATGGGRAGADVPSAARQPSPFSINVPAAFRRAVERGTRTTTGEPGPAYWQQWTDYRLDARLLPDARRLEGSALLRYHNRSPDALDALYVHLLQNLHAPGAIRLEPAEVTGGVELQHVAIDGRPLSELPDTADPAPAAPPGWKIDGTLMTIVPSAPVDPGASVEIAIDYAFAIPRAGAGARMGYSGDDLFFLGYWYPIMAVYDDVVGWHTDRFLSNAEFYAGFGRYDVTVDAPADWLVIATGELQNPNETLSDSVRARLELAGRSDRVVRIVTPEDFGRLATAEEAGPRIGWRFVADSVRDVAFSATRASHWDANRAPVGDIDGDGRTDYALVNALYREAAGRWRRMAGYMTHAIPFLSEFTGIPYPWPHMTAVEGGGIIGGGMEFPMMTLIGDYTARGDSALYYVTAHELAHMWIPMIVSNDERRYAWMDEGTTTFNENMARMDFFPGRDHHAGDREDYLETARADAEGEILRWSDFHYPGPAYRTASYAKPATVLVALREVLGEETFMEAYRTLYDRWAFRHPYPWDFFHTFEDVSGEDLDWFWRAWYYETWTLDHAAAAVEPDNGATTIVVEDRGRAPMPVPLTVTCADGRALERRIPVDVWLEGAARTSVTVECAATRVEIDAAERLPDIDRANNVWTAGAGAR